MRRNVALYIGGLKADIGEQSLILMNWTQEDAAAPTAVVAPYSQQVTLKGTPANNRIFGGFWKLDRQTASGDNTGAAFDPLRKTPFEIRNAQGETIEDGYVRLDEITRKSTEVSYKITLFGSIGSFFYGLSYNEDGTPMTLADLNYTTAGGETELDFLIDKTAVEDAWADLGTGSDPIWRVINFAPAYEGIPDGDFDPAKGVVTPSRVNLTVPAGYSTKGTLALMNLPSSIDQWAAKDLRSYMQRPVINFGAIIGGIVRKAADLGYTFDASSLADSMGNYKCDPSEAIASNIWLTLQPITAIAPTRVSGAVLTKTSGDRTSNPVAEWDVSGVTVPSGTKVTFSLSSGVVMKVNSTTPTPTLAGWTGNTVIAHEYFSVIFCRFIGFSSGVEVASSKIITLNLRYPAKITPADAYKLLNGGSGPDEDEFGDVVNQVSLSVVDATSVRLNVSLDNVLEGYDVDHVELQIVKTGTLKIKKSGVRLRDITLDQTSTFLPYYFVGSWNTTRKQALSVNAIAGSNTDTVAFNVPSSLRSGALITKRLLLGSTKTPAQYLLSFAKQLGLYFASDPATKTVTICKRAEFYNGDTIDLTKRVDVETITIKPLAVASKWYEFTQEVKGAFSDTYSNTYGATYGAKRINTGYEFNDETKDIISSSVLRGAVTALERSKYFNYIVDTDGYFRPSVELDEGLTWTVWDTYGKNLDTAIAIPGSNEVTLTYYNTDPDCQGYDQEFANKLQLHTADGKAVDGADILVFFEGRNTYEYFKISDDNATMYAITGGKACWDLDPGSSLGISIPSFQRFVWSGGGYVEASGLEFGAPRELSFPRQTISNGDDRMIYGRSWRSYLQDRYNRDTKVMTCKVDLAGLPVGQQLLRCFWWYEGALWVLNKISNYSVTTAHLTECEFVQVQDKDAYVNGQNFA